MLINFEIAKGWEDKELRLPERKTKYSAGYDFNSAEDVTIKPGEIKLVHTGVKVHLQDDQYLMLANRSSNPIKRGLLLANGVGIIDADYYNNEDNDGEIMFAFMNIRPEIVEIHKGDAIGQGIVQTYLTTDYDEAEGTRTGGFGSTN